MIKTKKAQVSTIDFILGLGIMIFAFILAINLLVNIRSSSDFDLVKEEALQLSDKIFSEGIPSNWNTTSVISLGILSENQLNISKLSLIQTIPYNQTKRIMGLSYDYYFYFANESSILALNGVCGQGQGGVLTDINCTPTYPATDNLIEIERLIVYNQTLLRSTLVVWD